MFPLPGHRTQSINVFALSQYRNNLADRASHFPVCAAELPFIFSLRMESGKTKLTLKVGRLNRGQNDSLWSMGAGALLAHMVNVHDITQCERSPNVTLSPLHPKSLDWDTSGRHPHDSPHAPWELVMQIPLFLWLPIKKPI